MISCYLMPKCIIFIAIFMSFLFVFDAIYVSKTRLKKSWLNILNINFTKGRKQVCYNIGEIQHTQELKQSHHKQYEIIILDDANSDQILEFLII